MVWDDDDDSWFADCPVVLDFDGERLEINHQKFDDVSITWCTIDVTRAPTWPTSDSFRLRWRDDAPAPLSARRGQLLEAVDLLEYAGGDLADGTLALGLRFSDGWLTIYNALDENGVARMHPWRSTHRPNAARLERDGCLQRPDTPIPFHPSPECSTSGTPRVSTTP